jgi:hypothetical protein
MAWMVKEFGFNPQLGQEIFSLFRNVQIVVDPILPPVQWVLWTPAKGIRPPGCHVDRSPPCSADVKNI